MGHGAVEIHRGVVVKGKIGNPLGDKHTTKAETNLWLTANYHAIRLVELAAQASAYAQGEGHSPVGPDLLQHAMEYALAEQVAVGIRAGRKGK